MKPIVMALAASFALAWSIPTFAADQTATGKPVQLAQRADKAKAGKDKGKSTSQAAESKEDGGAAPGDTRSDQVQDMKKSKPSRCCGGRASVRPPCPCSIAALGLFLRRP